MIDKEPQLENFSDREEVWQLVRQVSKSLLINQASQIEKWRSLDAQGSIARRLRIITEILTGAKQAIEENPEKVDEIKEAVISQLSLSEISSEHLRTLQFLAYFAHRILGLEPLLINKEVEEICQRLSNFQSSSGFVDVFTLLSSPLSLEIKRQWILHQVLPRVLFLSRRDLQEAEKTLPPVPEPPESSEVSDFFPPPDRDKIRPSIDEQEKEMGEPRGYFIVTPFYGGYYREGVYEEWDATDLSFKRKPRQLELAETPSVIRETRKVMQGTVLPGEKIPLPCPYNFAFLPETLKVSQGEMRILEDGNGNYIIDATKGREPISFSISLAKRTEPKREIQDQISFAVSEIATGELSEKTESFLRSLAQDTSLSPLEKARRLKQYVRGLLRYPETGDSRYNEVYYQNPRRFFQAIDEHKIADCDVANTFFIALLSRLGISARLVVGHYVKVKDNQGRAIMSSSTRHAWCEVWDDGWYRLDATPAGAPELDEKETDEMSDENFEGDFGEIEAEILSDAELERLIEEVKRLQEGEETPSLKELKALHFAEEADCSEGDARRILAQIEAARETKDSKGRKILDLLAEEFQRIIQQNLKEVLAFRTPVRMSEGDELVEPVETWIDIKTGESDPTGFAYQEKRIEREQQYGGFDVILVVDKSGSMGEIDAGTGQPKWREQQKFVFLVFDALYRFVLLCQRNRFRLLSPIDIRICLISFQGNESEIVLPLISKWGPKEQYKVWKALQQNIGGGTPDHLGLQSAARVIRDDTGHGEIKENINIVEAVGLTSGARQIEATYYPNGKCLASIAEAPTWVAQRIIGNVQHLYPQKVGRATENRPKKRLRLIIVSADGESDNVPAVREALDQLRNI